jgi:hypothetical protein
MVDFMIKGIQIVGIVVGLYLIAQTYRNYKNGSNNGKRAILWLLLWSAMIILFSNPSLMEFALPILTTRDTIMSILVLGILLSFVLIVQLWQYTYRIEKRIITLTQNLAITDYVNQLGQKEKTADGSN